MIKSKKLKVIDELLLHYNNVLLLKKKPLSYGWCEGICIVLEHHLKSGSYSIDDFPEIQFLKPKRMPKMQQFYWFTLRTKIGVRSRIKLLEKAKTLVKDGRNK